MDKNRILKVIVAITLLVVITIAITISIPLIKTLENPEQFRSYIESFGHFSSLVYFLLNIAQILVPIIPGEPMELIAGYAFGIVKGSILCLLAECLGSIIVILLVKKYGRKLVLFFFNENKLDNLKFLQDEKKSEMLITILFLIPGTPKDLLCYFVGLTNIDIKTLLIVSSLCRIPSIITSTLIGGGLGDRSYKFTIVVFIITTILSLFGIVTFNRLKDKHNKKEI